MERECVDRHKTKAETEARKRVKGCRRRRKKKAWTEMRFTLAAGL